MNSTNYYTAVPVSNRYAPLAMGDKTIGCKKNQVPRPYTRSGRQNNDYSSSPKQICSQLQHTTHSSFLGWNSHPRERIRQIEEVEEEEETHKKKKKSINKKRF